MNFADLILLPEGTAVEVAVLTEHYGVDFIQGVLTFKESDPEVDEVKIKILDAGHDPEVVNLNMLVATGLIMYHEMEALENDRREQPFGISYLNPRKKPADGMSQKQWDDHFYMKPSVCYEFEAKSYKLID